MWSCIAHSKYVGSVYYDICKALSLTIELAICVVPVACWIYLCISWPYVKIMHKYTPQCEGLIHVNNFFKCFLKAWDKSTPPGVYKERKLHNVEESICHDSSGWRLSTPCGVPHTTGLLKAPLQHSVQVRVGGR